MRDSNSDWLSPKLKVGQKCPVSSYDSSKLFQNPSPYNKVVDVKASVSSGKDISSPTTHLKRFAHEGSSDKAGFHLNFFIPIATLVMVIFSASP